MKLAEQSIGVFTTDADLIVRSWDACLERLTAIPTARALGQPLSSLIPDLQTRGLLARFERVLAEGVVEVLAPAFHHYLIPCPPQTPTHHFAQMQQRVTLAPLREDERIVGVLVTLVDVTARLDGERALIEQLHGADEETRRQATARRAATAPLPESEAQRVQALGAENWQERQAAVSELSQKAAPETIATLLQLLRQEHHNLSLLNSALQVLALSEVDVIAPLTEFLRDVDVDLRVQAALALGEQRDARAVPALLAALEDADANVRYHAIEALGKIRAPQAVEPLLTLAETGDFFLAFPALDALLRIGDERVAPRLVPLLRNDLLCGPATDALGQLGDEEVVAPLTELLNQPQAPSLVIAQALAALQQRYETLYQEGAYIAELARAGIRAPGVQNLLAALEAATAEQMPPLVHVLGWLEGAAVERALTQLIGQPTARQEVIEALVRHGARVTDLLLEQLNAADLPARQAAVIALGRIGDRRAVPALVHLLKTDQDLVIEIAGALAKLGDERAFEALLELLGAAQASVRQAAIAAINSLGHPAMSQRAVTLLHDPDPRVRESAVKIAGYFGYAECVELLLARCHDADENVRRAAVEHLPYLDDDRLFAALAEALTTGTPKVRAAAAQALGQVEGPQSFPDLRGALQDGDAWVRYFAARSLGRHRCLEALEELAQLAQADPAGHVRIAALEALGQLGGARAVALIAPLATVAELDLACAALKALGTADHPAALPPLQAALRSGETRLRVAALSGLAARGSSETSEILQWVAAAEEDPQVSKLAIEALARLATPAAIQALIELTADRTCREDCLNTLAQLNARRIDELARGLQHPHAEVRRAVVEALGRMKKEAATAWLRTALADTAGPVRLAAVHALGRLGSRQVEQQLFTLARTDPEPTVRRAAARALRKFPLTDGTTLPTDD